MTTGWRANVPDLNGRLSAVERNSLLNTEARQGTSCGRDETMMKIGLAAVVAGSIAAAGCTTYPDNGYGYGYGYGPPPPPPPGAYYNNGYYYDSQGRRIATGAAIGAAGGAVAGAVLPGVSPVGGAVAGAVLGGVLGAVVNNRQYYRDTRGYCYYVDQNGQPHYSYDVRC
jgi:hypothetical protein